jgi:hypothetical protein
VELGGGVYRCDTGHSVRGVSIFVLHGRAPRGWLSDVLVLFVFFWFSGSAGSAAGRRSNSTAAGGTRAETSRNQVERKQPRRESEQIHGGEVANAEGFWKEFEKWR